MPTIRIDGAEVNAVVIDAQIVRRIYLDDALIWPNEPPPVVGNDPWADGTLWSDGTGWAELPGNDALWTDDTRWTDSTGWAA